MSRIINKRCDVCDSTIKYAQYWSRHCKTKKHIRNLKNLGTLVKPTSNQPVTNQKPTSNQPITNRQPTSNQPVENNNIYGRCIYCNKGFKHNQSYYRHIKYRCKKRPQETTQITNTNTNSHNTTTTNSNNNSLQQTINNNQQITLNVYGEETIKKNFLTNDLVDKLKLCNGDLSKIYLLLNKELYLKEEKNNNIKYTNIQSEYCQILSKNNNWILKRLLEVMTERGVVVKNELEKELERVIKDEGIKTNALFPDPKLKDMQIMYRPLEKFEDNVEEIDEEDDDIKELYKKYQIELYNLRKKKKKRLTIIEEI
jgi:hypothetical protein